MQTTGTTHWAYASQWLPTGFAARALGCSSDTLKRYADRDEFLIDGLHWRRGPHRNSPRVWNLEACKQEIQRRGRLRYRGQGKPKTPLAPQSVIEKQPEGESPQQKKRENAVRAENPKPGNMLAPIQYNHYGDAGKPYRQHSQSGKLQA